MLSILGAKVKNLGIVSYPFAVVLYFFVVFFIGCAYSWMLSAGVYYQSNFLLGFLVGIMSFIPYLLLGLLLAFLTKHSPGKYLSVTPFKIIQSWEFWIFLGSLLLLILGIETPVGEANTMGTGRGLIQFAALWFGGVSSGLVIFRWFNRKFSQNS